MSRGQRSANGAIPNAVESELGMLPSIRAFHTTIPNEPAKPAARDDLLTVVITNFGRHELLEKCVASVVRAGLPNVVVASIGVDETNIAFHERLRREQPTFKSVLLATDPGCNESWLQGVYRATTPFVLILHDDDELTEEFAAYYWGIIRPELARGIGWVLWDGRVKERGVVLDEYHTTLPPCHGRPCETGYYEPVELVSAYRDNSRCLYPISPVVQIVRTDVAKQALKECESQFLDPVYFTRPTMMIGNEILLTLRTLQQAVMRRQKAFYVRRALTYFGRHAGSESQVHRVNGTDGLVRGYRAARDYFNQWREPPAAPLPRLIHAVNTFAAKDEATARRNRVAMSTWLPHYESGQLLFCPVPDSSLQRDSSLFGDSRRVPFVRDVIAAGIGMAAAEDAVVITNSDICLTTDAPQKITDALRAA